MIDLLEPRCLFTRLVPTPTFGDRGVIVIPNTTKLTHLSDISLIGLSGNGATEPYAIQHYTAAGEDKTYSGDGVVTVTSVSYDTPQLAAAAKGRLVVSTQKSKSAFVVFRLRASGGIDPTFASTPLKINSGLIGRSVGLAIDRFQRVYLGVAVRIADQNPVDYRVYRFNADGTIDRTYGNKGYAVAFSSPKLTATPIDLQPDAGRTGAIFSVVQHGRNAIVRKLTAEGAPDPSFGTRGDAEFLAAPDAGFNAPPSITGLRVDAKNRPLIAGLHDDDYPTMYLTRRTPTGAADTTFAKTGQLALQTTKFASMEEPLYDRILDYEVSPVDGSLYVLTDDAFYHFNEHGTAVAGTNGGLLDLGQSDTYPAFGAASSAAAIGLTPKPMQFELSSDGRLFSAGYIDIRQDDNGEFGVPQYRLVELAPAADALVSRKTLYVSGTEGSDRIRVTLSDDRVQLVRKGVTTTFPARKVSRVQIDLRQGTLTDASKYDQALVDGGLPAVVFGSPQHDRLTTVDPSIIVAGNEDTIYTGPGNDTLYLSGGSGGRVSTGDGDDLLVSTTESSLLAADLGAGNDRLELGGNYSESGGTFLLGPGDDRAIVNSRSNIIHGGRGVDRFIVNGYDNFVDGGPGNDTFDATGQRCQFAGGDGDDLFVLGINAMLDTIDGGLGNDTWRAAQAVITKNVERHQR